MSAELQTMAAAPTVGEAASVQDAHAAVQAAHPAGEAASSGKFPAKQQQNDEAQAPLDDQERRAVQKRLQRKADKKRAEKASYASGSMSTRQPASGSMSTRTDRDLGAGARTPKGSWLSGRLTGRRTARGGSGAFGYLSSRSTAQSTVRSMMSTSRSMMTTARSDVATGRYNDAENVEITETRVLEMRNLAEAEEDERRRRAAHGAARTGKTPRKSASSTAAGLRAGLLRRGAQLRGQRSSTGRTPRTARMGAHNQRQPGERPSHGG